MNDIINHVSEPPLSTQLLGIAAITIIFLALLVAFSYGSLIAEKKRLKAKLAQERLETKLAHEQRIAEFRENYRQLPAEI